MQEGDTVQDSAHCCTISVPNGANIALRPLSRSDSLGELTALLHRAYKPLADMGFRFFATHQSVDDTARRLEHAYCWVAVQENTIVATIALYGKKRPNERCAWYTNDGVWFFGQFAVAPELQGMGVGNRLLDMVESFARDNHASEIALDTAEGATHLIRLYTQRGYRFVEHVQWDVTNYRSVVLSKTLAHGVGVVPHSL